MTLNLDEVVRGGTFCLSKAGLAIGGTNTKAKTAAPNGAGVDYVINGVLYHKADTDDLVVLSGDAITALYTNIFLVMLDSAGACTVVQGTEVLTASLAASDVVLEWPEPTADKCCIGAIIIDAGAGAFTPGTTALTGGTVTVEYIDLFAVPSAPTNS